MNNKVLTNKQKLLLEKSVIGKWLVNPDNGLVDVHGDVYLVGLNLTEIPVKFGSVTGYFNCSSNELTSLKGSPSSVGNFYCHFNKLTSLKGAPRSVLGTFECSNNQLNNLLWAPKLIGRNFYCKNNPLASLLGFPDLFRGTFYIDLMFIDYFQYPVIISQIEKIVKMGVNLYQPERFYYPYKEKYYINRLIEII
jgi:hypothetical protein